MKESKRYPGIHNEINGGMTDIGKLIRDAWVFGLIPESESCEGWLAHEVEQLWMQVDAEWEKYGFRVGNLSEELRGRYLRIHNDAMARARQAGWDAERELSGDE